MKNLLICLSVMLLSGCATENLCKYSAIMTEPVNSRSLSYSDDDFSIYFNLEQKYLRYELKNRTNSAIRINWDEVVFINNNSRSMRLVHAGVKYTDVSLSQAPSVIAPKTSSADIVIPTENIHFISGQYGGWTELDLFPKNCNNCTFGLYFPLIINGNKKELNFRFLLDQCVEVSDSADGSVPSSRRRMSHD